MSAEDLDASRVDPDKVAPLWEEDTNVKNCVGCDVKFSMMKRKHHCRACGRIFCDTCSPHKDELPESFDMKGPQRTCDMCHLNLEKCFWARSRRMSKTEGESSSSNLPGWFPQLRLDADPAAADRPDVPTVHAELMQKLKDLCSEPEDHWARKFDKKGVKLDVKKMKDSALVVVRCEMQVDASLGKVIAIYNDKSLWGSWQPDMLKCQTLETINEDAEYIYVLYKVPVLDNRDVCIYSAWINGTVNDPQAKGAKSLISTSVGHPLGTSVRGTVRAKINLGLAQFVASEKDGRPHTTITSYFHTDPRGIIPPRIVNSAIGKTVDQMAQMIKFMESSDIPEPEKLPADGDDSGATKTALV
ncbi:uncharacterized protein MONBRDRAFT_31115 [Monosiga brevicollis MX1]|uniref:FYVE-type domain-containing protein n=1 Tax=Monosiga brevicollis TaxID=81824 RepID=A9URU2_MONBE|nr:uncharacterized protein MONBRDRAFT_31115 [Monosiga brevicollis MX1]EDQ91985.1 predicted protein [Monosiga brevicollis MX1]|eukprot:XP_001743271.1 hypothetical protein [Monosiga brevicollis MX1]